MVLLPSLYYPSPCPISPFNNAGGRHPKLPCKRLRLDRRKLARGVAQSSGGRCSADRLVLSGVWSVHAHMMGMQVADLDLSSRHQQGSLFRIDYGNQLEQLEELEG